MKDVSTFNVSKARNVIIPLQRSKGRKRNSNCFWQPSLRIAHKLEYSLKSEAQTGKYSTSCGHSKRQEHRGYPSAPISQLAPKSQRISRHADGLAVPLKSVAPNESVDPSSASVVVIAVVAIHPTQIFACQSSDKAESQLIDQGWVALLELLVTTGLMTVLW